MRRLLILLILGLALALKTYAHAGVYDSINEYRHWIFPAYLYCLIFGILFMVALGSTFRRLTADSLVVYVHKPTVILDGDTLNTIGDSFEIFTHK